MRNQNTPVLRILKIGSCCNLFDYHILQYKKPVKMKKIRLLTGIASALAMMTVLSTTSAYAQQDTKLSDAEIASAAVVANQSDIDFAKIAKQKSKNAEVLKFAETMAKDHQAVIDQAVALVTKLNVTPKDNPVSKKLAEDAGKTKKMLLSKSAGTFNQ